MHVVFRCTASPEIGGGHVGRCIGLADAFAADGHHVLFAVCRKTPDSAPALRASPYPWLVVEDGVPLDEQLHASLGRNVDVIVFDHPGTVCKDENAARHAASRIVVIDDLADQPHDCDMLVNSGGSATQRDYERLVPSACRLLLGPGFAPMSPRFHAFRPASLARRAQSTGTKAILVSFGLTDPVNATCRALAALKPLSPPSVVVAIGAGAPHLVAVRDACAGWAELDIDSMRMPELMASVDLAIGAAGSSSWERCCLGLPSLAVTIADNQRGIADMLQRSGAAETMSILDASIEAMRRAATSLLADGDRRREMSRAAASLCDGEGARRVVEALTR
jgi:UDP-2,4-diacetamido-2,4,6-trideoxy-beta-L-altropyranose hydrolase